MILAVFEIRAYTSIEGLIQQNWQHDHIRAFPLSPKHIDNDYPTWDGGGIPSDVEDEILRLEHEEDFEYFDDIVEEIYAIHKIGGYPAFVKVVMITVRTFPLYYRLPQTRRHISISSIMEISISF